MRGIVALSSKPSRFRVIIGTDLERKDLPVPEPSLFTEEEEMQGSPGVSGVIYCRGLIVLNNQAVSIRGAYE